MRISVLLLLLLLIPLPLPGGEQCAVELKLDRTQCLIGDWLHLDILTESSEYYRPLWPEWGDRQLGPFQILAADRINPDQQRLTVAVYALDRQVLPSFQFPFIDLRDSSTFTLQTDSLVVQVFTVRDSITVAEAPRDSAVVELLDIYPPGQRPLTWYDWLPYLSAGVLFLLLGWLLLYFWRRWQRQNSGNVIMREQDQRTPGERARDELQQVKTDKLWQRGEVVEHYFRITLVLRRYLEWQTGEVVAEMTTSEVEQFLVALDTPRPGELLLNLLQQADLVKFASYLPADDLHDRFWLEAHALLAAWEEWFTVQEGINGDREVMN